MLWKDILPYPSMLGSAMWLTLPDRMLANASRVLRKNACIPVHAFALHHCIKKNIQKLICWSPEEYKYVRHLERNRVASVIQQESFYINWQITDLQICNPEHCLTDPPDTWDINTCCCMQLRLCDGWMRIICSKVYE